MKINMNIAFDLDVVVLDQNLCPQVVVELRKLCPDTKIIQYGARF